MRALLASICLVLSRGLATAQPAKTEDLNAPTGRSAPEDKGQLQPQGWTGRPTPALEATGARRVDKNYGRAAKIAVG